ncbi:hypothetical protein KPATCC21470_1139 [Kitasatospora purpeofusca]
MRSIDLPVYLPGAGRAVPRQPRHRHLLRPPLILTHRPSRSDLLTRRPTLAEHRRRR